MGNADCVARIGGEEFVLTRGKRRDLKKKKKIDRTIENARKEEGGRKKVRMKNEKKKKGEGNTIGQKDKKIKVEGDKKLGIKRNKKRGKKAKGKEKNGEERRCE